MRPRILITALFALITSACNDGTDWPLLFAQNSVVSAGVVAAADAQEVDRLGSSTAIDGDLAAFGAPNEDGGPGNPLPETGAVYVFERGETTWESQAKLLASDAGANYLFGSAVEISGNYLIAGAPGRASSLGGVYVFERDTETGDWDLGASPLITDLTGTDMLGAAVAISGDWLAVGGPGHDTGGTDAGAVWISERTGPGNTWSNGVRLQASDAQMGDQFGWSVALSGDWLAVGAPGEDGPSDQRPDAGAVYVFHRTGPGNVWDAGTKLVPDSPGLADQFGFDVDLSGERMIVGAPGDDGTVGDSVPSAGTAYIFEYSDMSWQQTEQLRAVALRSEDFFGFSVGVDGNLAIVGVPGWDCFNPYVCVPDALGDDIGVVYVWGRYEDGTWGVRGILPNLVSIKDDRMGWSVGVSGAYLSTGASEGGGAVGNDVPDAGTGYFYKSPTSPPIICSPISWSCI